MVLVYSISHLQTQKTLKLEYLIRYKTFNAIQYKAY